MLNQIMLTIIAGALVSCGASETSLKEYASAEIEMGNMEDVEDITLQEEELLDEEYGVAARKARKARKARPADPARVRRARGTKAPVVAKTAAAKKAAAKEAAANKVVKAASAPAAVNTASQVKLNMCVSTGNLLKTNSAKYKTAACLANKDSLTPAKAKQCKTMLGYDKRKVVSYRSAGCPQFLNGATKFTAFQKKKIATLKQNITMRNKNMR